MKFDFFSRFKQPINPPVMAEFDKIRLESFRMQADLGAYKRAREDAELADHAKTILKILENRQ
jgi:hypothetical protein